VKVLVVDSIAEEGLGYLRERGFQVDELLRPKLPDLYERIGGYEALITRSLTAVTPELLRHAAQLRIVGRAGVGVDNIDVDACSRRGIVVVNAPHGNVVSAAEHTVGMLLALVRHIPQAHRLLTALEWNRNFYGAELFRKTVGVVGLGKVGSRVAARLRAFETRILVYDPYVSEARARDLGATLTDFATVLRESDVVTFHTPLTSETDNMLTARELGAMKPGVRIVNCARGGIVNEADLLAALEGGHVAGAAIDVWTEEPPRSDVLRRLIGHPRVIVTPHLGANSSEAQVNVALDVARQIVAFRDGEMVEFGVNVPVADPAALGELRPFITLADRLGRFLVQLDPAHLSAVEVRLAGAVGQGDPELIARAVLSGLLGPVMAGPVNLVNAHLVAQERGVGVSVVREDATHGYGSLLTVSTETREGRKIIAGAVFDGQPRVVQLRDLNIEFAPEGYILVLSYEDRPGMVGRIGSILGALNVNIASMHVGRRSKRGSAIVVLILDEDLTNEQVAEVASAVDADFARLIRLAVR
jgi:D-3-phosphoglycerate dehydrogenase